MTNPMDGYRDIYPWPYQWERDFDDDTISNLIAVELVYPEIQYWTYNNHWSAANVGTPKTPKGRCVDLYWSDDNEERLQLPPDIGDHITQIIIATIPDKIRYMIWMHRWWQPTFGWHPWRGEQGDFVDHIHLEFNAPE